MLFSGLIDEFKDLVQAEVLNVPSNRANFRGIVQNCFFASKKSAEIVHVTGHINYLAIFTGRKTILTIHDIGSSINRKWPYLFVFSLLWFKLPVFFTKRVTVISEFTRNELLKITPNASHKIRVIPNPVNSEFSFQPNTFNSGFPKILIVGTKPNKNLERTILALAGLNCELVILGKLNSIQIGLLNSHQITFTNLFNLNFEKVVQIYQECDLLCFPSTYEGFGLPILEAQATGRPVITSNIGAMKEVAGESACLVDPFDGKSIREGVEKVILNREYREGLIEKGLENVNKYKIETIAQQYYSLYQELESD
jgi:glycosyltransferase involved in cell wall biosynthesis